MMPPEQLSSGTIYLVIVTDTSSGVSVQASFTAQ
jgi:hypothetical protein